jgi:hypothetical protein
MFVIFSDANDFTSDNDNLFVNQAANDQFDALIVQEKRHPCHLYEKVNEISFLLDEMFRNELLRTSIKMTRRINDCIEITRKKSQYEIILTRKRQL